MKSLVLSSVAIAMLVFSGCADKEPVVEEKPQTENVSQKDTAEAKEVAEVATETVSQSDAVVADNRVETSDSGEMDITALENELNTLYFDFDKFNIRADMQSNIDKNVEIANGGASKYAIKLEGNCDEWGSDEYNYALGLKRASSVKKALVAQGVSASRISMVTYGESNPVCTEKTQECWAKNRRVDFKLLP